MTETDIKPETEAEDTTKTGDAGTPQGDEPQGDGNGDDGEDDD